MTLREQAVQMVNESCPTHDREWLRLMVEFAEKMRETCARACDDYAAQARENGAGHEYADAADELGDTIRAIGQQRGERNAP